MEYGNMSVSGSLNVDKVVARPPKGTRANRPSSPLSGSLFIEQSDSGSFMMLYTGISNIDDGWEMIGAQEPRPTDFKYRQVINYSYLAGGYKSSSPWKNIHKTVNSTDQTNHIGELLDYPMSYSSGACSKSILFIWSVNTDGAWKSATNTHGTTTSAVNMFNDTNYAHQAKFDITYIRHDLGTLFKETEFAYLFDGGNTNMERFNLTNESHAGILSSYNGGEGASGFSDENHGYGWGGFGGFKFAFATETHVTGTKWGAHGQQKGISSKNGKGYAGNEGSYAGGYNLRRWDNTSDTNIGNVVKPHPNCGEENFTMGQDHQYMLGVYDGTQNNTSWKFIYSTDTGTTSVQGLNPGVNAGTSSGHCGWRE